MPAAGQAESVELYRQALLTSLAEAENALSAVERSRAREALLLEIVEEARLTARLARLQYIEGEADLRGCSTLEQRLIQAEDAQRDRAPGAARSGDRPVQGDGRKRAAGGLTAVRRLFDPRFVP